MPARRAPFPRCRSWACRILIRRQVLSDGSYLARIYASDSDRRADRNGIDVRIIEYVLNDSARDPRHEKHRLLTTLLDPALDPAVELVELYHARWEEELAIDELKTHLMERPVLHSQTPAGVVQEVYGLLLGHYVVRSLMFEAAEAKGVSPVRMSFTGTLKILRCRLPECPSGQAGRRRWFQRLLEEVGEETIPPRRDRLNPRVIRKPQSKWPKKRPIHRPSPRPAQSFRECVVIVR